MRQEMMGFGDALASAGPYANNVTTLQTDDYTNTSSLIFTGRMLFLMPNQQCQSTEGKSHNSNFDNKSFMYHTMMARHYCSYCQLIPCLPLNYALLVFVP